MTDFVERLDHVEEAWDLYIKGYKESEIAVRLGVTRTVAKNLVADGKLIVQRRADADPDFMTRVQENTLRTLDEIDLISKEAWETYQFTKDNEMANQQVNALKLAKELAETKARLVSLLGSNVDGSNILQMRKLERVNEIVSGVIKEVVANCDHCKLEAQIKLAEAFRLMEREDEIIHIEPQFELSAIEDDEVDPAMLTDILNREE